MAADHCSCMTAPKDEQPKCRSVLSSPSPRVRPSRHSPSPMGRPTDTHPSPRVSRWLSRSEGMKSSSSSELKSLFFLLTAPSCRLHSTGWGEHTKANSLGKVHG